MTDDRGPAPSGARLLGDDYQHLLTWLYAAQLLRADPQIVRVELEKRDAGNVDDVVVHRSTGMCDYHQVKFSTKPAADPLAGDWFITKGTARHSPLQRFRDSWRDLTRDGARPSMVLHTNRLVDPKDPVLACLSGDRALLVPKLARAKDGSPAGCARAAWADHLGTTEDQLLELLGCLQIRAGRASLAELQEHCALVMDAAGLLVSPEALDVGMLAARRWIQDGVREIGAETMKALVDEHGLRAPHRRATVLVQAIDHDPHPELADIALDWVDAFEGDDPGARRVARSPEVWATRFAPELRAAAREIRAKGATDVRLTGAFRLTPALFAGAVFSDTAGYTLAIAGRSGDSTWTGDITSDGDYTAADLRAIETEVGRGHELAVGLSASADLSADVLAHLDGQRLPVARFIELRLPEPSRHALADAAAMRGWATAVSDYLRALTRADPPLMHLFLAAPRPAALLLGHQWNRIAPTQLWEEITPGHYARSFVATTQVGFN